MQIELLGLPASGKSTYAKKLKESNRKINLIMEDILYSKYRVCRNFNKLKLTANFILFNYTDFKKLILFFKPLEFITMKRKIKMFIYAISILDIVKRCDKEKINVLDEGICQLVWAISYNVKNLEINKILKFFDIFSNYISDEIIILHSDVNILKGRLLKRNEPGGSELQHEIHKDENKIYFAKDLLYKIINYLNNNYTDRIKYGDNNYEKKSFIYYK